MRKHRIYISLGSNLGNRYRFLQRAIVAISQRLGEVTKISKVYETPAWGFVSTPFYNACAEILTDFSAEEFLGQLLEIEQLLGRKRNSTTEYQERTIDLDILFYDDAIIQTKKIIVPHPKMELRRFVLQPLNDIASEFLHPVLNRKIKSLLADCQDNSLIKEVENTLFIPKKISFIEQFNYIAIEGNIGSGKTSLATKISEDFSKKLLLENFSKNPFLSEFYEKDFNNAFLLEMSFLLERFYQIQEVTTENEQIVSDYDITKSLIFSNVTLNEQERNLFLNYFQLLFNNAKKPDLYIYLLQNTNKVLENISVRGRSFEENISEDYLDKIQNEYLHFLENFKMPKVLIIDISDLDFVQNDLDYQYILSLINFLTNASDKKNNS